MTLKCLVSFPVAPVMSALPQVSLLRTVGKRVDQSLKLLPFSVNRFLRCIPPASRVNSFSTRSQVLYHGHGHKRSRRGSIQT
uniref:Putative secreted protein n=1 Tax=Anopheles darlingi TaxID=43151 RepID=A0A2M4DC94_ANODA